MKILKIETNNGVVYYITEKPIKQVGWLNYQTPDGTWANWRGEREPKHRSRNRWD